VSRLEGENELDIISEVKYRCFIKRNLNLLLCIILRINHTNLMKLRRFPFRLFGSFPC